ncbi:uncharacterized protein N7469_002285 [Penicillium citrinum]|uniref:Uncharacterized protein n=1 Tax=Penicillium citrinum TaxID=5077 RepID=A0A9W9PA16_PENCI|nr:uncharacterized protein N7469_002285 [Penicillium citrinum]KAJ5240694.1 hypothetical protein N7469_002285 [Penicillium citrinum]
MKQDDSGKNTLTTHDTALGIAAHARNREVIRALLAHQKNAPNLEIRWLESPLVLSVKGLHALVAGALLPDHRMDAYRFRTVLWFANDGTV